MLSTDDAKVASGPSRLRIAQFKLLRPLHVLTGVVLPQSSAWYDAEKRFHDCVQALADNDGLASGPSTIVLARPQDKLVLIDDDR